MQPQIRPRDCADQRIRQSLFHDLQESMNYSTTTAVQDIPVNPSQAAATTTALSSVARASQREVEIDVLRGWCMVMMIMMHIGVHTRLSTVVHLHQYVTAASGFVFLAGGMLGQVSRRRLERESPAAAYRQLGSRVLKLWLAHCVLMFGAVILHETTGLLPKMAAVSEVGGWMNECWMIPTLRLQSEYYLNILPMYIVFVALAPLGLEAMRRRMTALLMIVSGLLYLAAQYDPGLGRIEHPASGTQSFSLAAWQFLFFIGLALGWHREKLTSDLWSRHRHWMLPGCVALGAAMFVLGIFQRPSLPSLHLLNEAAEALWFNRITHAPGRLLAFFTAIVPGFYLIRCCLNHDKFPGPLRWLATMGQSSLYCFLVHLFFALTFRAMNTWSWPLWSQEILTAGTVVVIYFMARHKSLSRLIPN